MGCGVTSGLVSVASAVGSRCLLDCRRTCGERGTSEAAGNRERHLSARASFLNGTPSREAVPGGVVVLAASSSASPPGLGPVTMWAIASPKP